MLMLGEPSAGLNRGVRENLARLILRIKRELEFTMMRLERDMQIVAELADRGSLPQILGHARRRAGNDAQNWRFGRRARF
jgi:ABC-type branched-subunit amino acid transport system ATPase component